MCIQTQQAGDVLTSTWTDAEGNTHTVTSTKLPGETQAVFEARHQVKVNRESANHPPDCPGE